MIQVPMQLIVNIERGPARGHLSETRLQRPGDERTYSHCTAGGPIGVSCESAPIARILYTESVNHNSNK